MMLKFYKSFEEAERDAVFLKDVSLENLIKIYAFFEIIEKIAEKSGLSKKRKKHFQRGLIFYKSLKDALKDEQIFGY